MIFTVGTLLLSALVAWYLVLPHLTSVVVQGIGHDQSSLIDQKERCVQVIKDLELDYATQKVSEGDYLMTRSALERELAGILVRLEGGK